MVLCLRAVQTTSARAFAIAGLLMGCTTLARPVFVLLPAFLATVMLPFSWRAPSRRKTLGRWALLLGAFCVTLSPWFIYNYVHLGELTLSPAGGIGRGLWEGSWQGMWSGRLQATLTEVADEPLSPSERDRRVRAIATESGQTAEPMLTYVHQWRDIRQIWTQPQDPRERAIARIVADREYLRVALNNITVDPIGHVVRRATRGLFVLWAAEIPVRYSDINALPTPVIRLIWLVQVGLAGLALLGVVSLLGAGRHVEACLLVAPLVYVTLVHFPLLTEARQSLPVKPVLLLLATIGAVQCSRWLLPLKPEVHER